MNKLIDGTEYRTTWNGIVAVRGNRTLHLLGTSVTKQQKAKELLASVSFNKLFNQGETAGTTYFKNTRWIKL